jgi:hypothetical protein
MTLPAPNHRQGIYKAEKKNLWSLIGWMSLYIYITPAPPPTLLYNRYYYYIRYIYKTRVYMLYNPHSRHAIPFCPFFFFSAAIAIFVSHRRLS